MKTIKKYWYFIVLAIVFIVSIGLNIYFFNVGSEATDLYNAEKDKFEMYKDSISEVFVEIQKEHETLTGQIVEVEEELEIKKQKEWLNNRTLRNLRATLDDLTTQRKALITNPNMSNEEMENYINNEFYRDSIDG
jgi:chromosome segregation ATPase